MVAVRQPSFAGGEFSPTLYGRTDLAKYGVAARRLHNLLVSPHGPAVKRAGSQHGAAANYAGAPPRIWPFVVSDDEAYCVEVGPYLIKFHGIRADGTFGVMPDDFYPFSLGCDYDAVDLPDLSFAQSGDVLTITHPKHPPFELRRIGGPPYPPPWFTLVQVGGVPIDFDTTLEPCIVAGTLQATDSQRTSQPWSWLVTILGKKRNGEVFESAPFQLKTGNILDGDPWSPLVPYITGDIVLGPSGVYWYQATNDNIGQNPETTGFAHWGPSPVYVAAGAGLPSTTYYTNALVYWGSNRHFYKALQTQDGSHPPPTSPTYWQDLGTDLTQRPGAIRRTMPIPTNVVLYTDRPIGIRAGINTSPAHAEWPGGGGNPAPPFEVLGYNFYRGREKLYGLVGFSNDLKFTDLAWDPDYSSPPPQATDPFAVKDATGAVVGHDYPSLAAHFEGRRLYANTPSRPTSIIGSSTIGYSNFDAGTPAKDSDSYEFALASLRREEIRALVPSRVLIALTGSSEWSIDGGSPGEPITPSAISARPHTAHGSAWLPPLQVGATTLFVQRGGKTVRALDFQIGADSLKAKDLSLLSKHLFVGHAIVAWAYAQEPNSMICAVRDDGVLLTLTYVEEHDVWAWSWSDTAAGDAYEDVCVLHESGVDNFYLVARRTVAGATKRYIERMTVPTIESAASEVYLDSWASVSATSGGDVSRLEWLEGRDVMFVGDGAVVGPFTVPHSGVVNVSASFPDGLPSSLVVGLPYTTELETLDLSSGQNEIRSRQKIVKEVGFEVLSSRGLSVGESFDRLVEVRERDVAAGWNVPQALAGLVNVSVSGRWSNTGRAALRQTDPLPLVVLGVVREVEFGGSGPT